MNTTDYKLDAILRCLKFYYSKFTYSNDIYRHSGDERDRSIEFVPMSLISAWLDFAENEKIIFTFTELTDLLNNLENEKLIISENIEGERKFKILPNGISLIEKSGYVRKYKRAESAFIIGWFALVISIIALAISGYNAFCKK